METNFIQEVIALSLGVQYQQNRVFLIHKMSALKEITSKNKQNMIKEMILSNVVAKQT